MVEMMTMLMMMMMEENKLPSSRIEVGQEMCSSTEILFQRRHTKGGRCSDGGHVHGRSKG